MISERIRKLRLEKGLTQKRLGEIVGTSTAYISEIERRDVDHSFTLIDKLSKALETTNEYLAYGDTTNEDEKWILRQFREMEDSTKRQLKSIIKVLKE